MTNLEIVAHEAVAHGLLTNAQVDEMILKYGILPFNTYQEWKRMGYQVKKGSKAVIKTKLWKVVNSKIQDEENDASGETKNNHSKFVLVSAALFGADQVEKIKRE